MEKKRLNRFERYVISTIISRYMGKIERMDMMLENILPCISKITGSRTDTVLDSIESLLNDWLMEVKEYKETKWQKK